MTPELISKIRDAAPAPESAMECGDRLGAHVAAEAKRGIAKGVCRLVCAYLKANADAELVLVDGAVYDAAPITPVKVADALTALGGE